MNKEDIKVGTFIWWSAERYLNSWSVPGVVLSINEIENKFTIMTFDTMQDTVLNFDGEAFNNEMKISNKDQVISYLIKKKFNLKKDMISHEESMESLKRSIQSLQYTMNMVEDSIDWRKYK